MIVQALKFLFFLVVFSTSAHASHSECTATSSEVTALREPRFGATRLWDVIYRKDGEDGMEVFSDLVPLDGQTVVAVGSYTKGKEDKISHPLLVKLDDRLKIVWEVREKTDISKNIRRIFKTKDGFVILGNVTDTKGQSGFYTASYSEDGKKKSSGLPVFEKGGELEARAFVPANDGNGYIVAAQFIDSKDAERQYGLLYKVSRGGSVLWKRSFQSGRATVFNTISRALDGGYIVAGQMVLNEDKSGAWFLNVDENGAVKWQQIYPRGLAATVQAVAQTKDGDYVLAGKARSTDPSIKNLSAWVMRVDHAGKLLWQRYFKGPYVYEASDLIVYEDGRASVLLSGQGTDSIHRSHARLATLSSQGDMLSLEDFSEGQNASAHRLVSGLDGERIIVGYTQVTFGDKQESNEASAAPAYTYDGWILAAQPLGAFEDVCSMKEPVSPILR